jgi:hypothetical protein
LAPKGFTVGVKAEIFFKCFQSAPKLLINAELYGLVLAPRLKKDTMEANLQPLGPNVPAFINSVTSMF